MAQMAPPPAGHGDPSLPGPAGGAPSQLDTVAELQAAGLLDYATSIQASFIRDVPHDVLQGTLLQTQSAVNAPRTNRGPGQPGSSEQQQQQHLHAPTAPAAGPAAGPSGIEAQHYATLNNLADLASVKAHQMLQVTRLRVHQVVSSYNPRSTPTGADGGGKRRKTSRNADGSGGRAGGKGLRHFSMKVCEKVESKGRTTYNEVADELVAEMSRSEIALGGQFDEKNIRRRVYDAINVLMAMDIIQKEKKEILWKGFPKTAGNALDRLKSERLNKIKEVEGKQAYLQDMVEQQKALKKLLERSGARAPSTQSSGTQLHLPFILVQAKLDATVEVKISEDMSDVQFDFYHSPFQIHDDSYVLKNIAQQQQQAALQLQQATQHGVPPPQPQQHAQQHQQALHGPSGPSLGGLAGPSQQGGGSAGQPAQQLHTSAGPGPASVAAAAAAAAAAATSSGGGPPPPLYPWPNGNTPMLSGGHPPSFHSPTPSTSTMADPSLPLQHLAPVATKANPAYSAMSPPQYHQQQQQYMAQHQPQYGHQPLVPPMPAHQQQQHHPQQQMHQQQHQQLAQHMMQLPPNGQVGPMQHQQHQQMQQMHQQLAPQMQHQHQPMPAHMQQQHQQQQGQGHPVQAPVPPSLQTPAAYPLAV